MWKIIWIACGWLISPNNCMICCTTAVSGSLDSWWDAPDNLVCCSQMFLFLIQVDVFGWWHFTVSVAYCVHFLLFWVFSHAVFWKLDFFLLSDARRESFPSVPITSFLSYTRTFPKCHTWKMLRWQAVSKISNVYFFFDYW